MICCVFWLRQYYIPRQAILSNRSVLKRHFAFSHLSPPLTPKTHASNLLCPSFPLCPDLNFYYHIHHFLLKNQLLLKGPKLTPFYIFVVLCTAYMCLNPTISPSTYRIIVHTVCAVRARQHLCLHRGSSRWACRSWRHSLSSRRKRCYSWFECRGRCRNYSSGQGRRRCHGRRAL